MTHNVIKYAITNNVIKFAITNDVINKEIRIILVSKYASATIARSFVFVVDVGKVRNSPSPAPHLTIR